MRLFYAIELDEVTRQILMELQNRLKDKAVKANYTQRENLHLTLRFMGEVDHACFPVLKKIQGFVSDKSEPFKLELTGPGAFQRGRKFLVWCGIRESMPLFELQKRLEKEIRLNGFKPESRAYSPHITLAREFVPFDNIRNVIDQLCPVNYCFNVNSISLMESTRVDGRLMYLCRYRTLLSK